MNKPTSFSQSNMYYKCPRAWFLQYVQRMPTVSDLTYAFAGNVIHKTLEKYYNGDFKDMDSTKKFFIASWENKKLHESKLAMKKDEYWLMIINGINLSLDVTTNEMKIFYPDVVGYLDVVNTKEDTIADWKSSTRRPENEEGIYKTIKDVLLFIL